MAEVTAFRNNALPYPIYGVPWVVVFPMLDEDGDPVTGLTCDSEVSLNGDTGVDCTNEAVEIPYTTATNKGMYYLILTAAEMTADIVAVTVYSGATTTQATAITLYPRKLVSIRSGTAAGGDTGYITLDASASANDDFYNGMVCKATIDSNVEVRVITDYTGSNKQAAVTPSWNVAPDSDDTFIVYLPEGVQVNQANVTHISGTAQTARDIGTSVLLSSGTGTGQISLSSGAVLLQATQTGVTIPTVTTLTNLPAVPTDWLTAAGVKADAVTKIQNGLATPTNITAGTITTVTDVTNAVKISAGTGAGQLDFTSGVVKSNLSQILGTALTETAGQIAAAFKKFFNVATPTGTVNSLPDAVAGANGGLPTTNGTKVTQTVDLTAGQSIAANGGTVATVTNLTYLPTMPNDWLTAAGIKDDAVTKIQSGLATPASVLAATVDGTYTLEDVLRIMVSALAGKVSGGGTTTITFRDLSDTLNMIAATVDANGNRSGVTITLE